jgi:hypothetical protein
MTVRDHVVLMATYNEWMSLRLYEAGCEHVAHQRGEARILVVEREGGI